MLRSLKFIVAKKLADTAVKQAVLQPDSYHLLSWNSDLERLAWCIRIAAVHKKSNVSKPQMFIPFSYLRACRLIEKTSSDSVFKTLSEQFKPDPLVNGLSVSKDGLHVNISSQHLVQSTLSDILFLGPNYGRHSNIYKYTLGQGSTEVTQLSTGQNVVVDYSSPNIAKPFHAGHLRSTILGQFIANVCSWFGQNVVRLNYLGDWGTQFGLLGVGFAKYGNMDTLNSSPVQHLFDVYVKINKDIESDETIHKTGMEYFQRLEQGDKDALSFWKLCRDLSIEEYMTMYKRLGVSFSHIHSESMYHERAAELVRSLDNSGLLQRDSKTGVGFLDLSSKDDKVPFYANLTKSDGTSLYLTRDIVAAIDRHKSFNADKLYYVVENGQHAHFKQLIGSLSRLGHDWVSNMTDLHVKFGRVEGMSTRRGQVVFLRDILDEAKYHMLETMKSKSTTKVSDINMLEEVAEALGVSAILIQDMKEYRCNNYKFSWERIVNFNGDTGVFLQYTHARLHSIVSGLSDQLASVQPAFECLTEDSALRLIQHLARFDEVLLKSYTQFEPCHLVHYLFTIGRLVNVAHGELYVRNQPDVIAKTRLVMFQSAKRVLSNGLEILGIRPLDRL